MTEVEGIVLPGFVLRSRDVSVTDPVRLAFPFCGGVACWGKSGAFHLITVVFVGKFSRRGRNLSPHGQMISRLGNSEWFARI
ncbi:MAG: hypothetical protein ACKOVA_01525 [Novosphingobium sp.]